MTERVLITGGTGFFGKSILDEWRKEPKAGLELVILSRHGSRFAAQFPEFANLPRVSFIDGDVRDFEFPDGDFAYVIHAATPAVLGLDDAEMTSIIVDGTSHVLKFARERKVKKLLLTSSGAVYGVQPPELPNISEDFPCLPVTAYGKGKLEAETMCLNSGVNCAIARCFAFAGKYLPMTTHFAIGNFMLNWRDRQKIVITGDGRNFRSYLAAPDLVDALWQMLQNAKPGSVYNVGSPEAISIYDLAVLIAGGQLPVEVLGKSAGGLPSRYVPSVERIRRELKLKQPIKLNDYIRQWKELL